MLLYCSEGTYDEFIKATIHGELDIVKQYIENKSLPDKIYIDAFHTACYFNRFNIVKYILDNSIETNKILDIYGFDNYFLFQQACKRDDIYILKYLFEYIMKYNILYYYEDTYKYNDVFVDIFKIACRNRNLNIIKYVIELYEKYNIRFDIIKCSFSIISIFDRLYTPHGYNYGDELIKYMKYLNTHNYNFTKYMYFTNLYSFMTDKYTFSNTYTQKSIECQSFIFVNCYKKNIIKKNIIKGRYPDITRYLVNNNIINFIIDYKKGLQPCKYSLDYVYVI